MANLVPENDEQNTIWCSVGITRNLGNYESLRIDAGSRITIDPSSDKDEAWKNLWEDVQAQIEAQLLDADRGLAEG
jgi:hypothetical protein